MSSASFSFDLAPSPPPFDSEAADLFDDGPDSPDDLGADPGADALGTNGKKKSKRPPSTAERRASHNAIERARRESLNGRFLELAHVLPSMSHVKRPSKSAIVAKSLDYVNETQARERGYTSEIADLRREVDDLRNRLGLPPRAPTAIPHSSRTSAAEANKHQQMLQQQHAQQQKQQQHAMLAGTCVTPFVPAPTTGFSVPIPIPSAQDVPTPKSEDGQSHGAAVADRRFSLSSAISGSGSSSASGGDSPSGSGEGSPNLSSSSSLAASVQGDDYLASIAAFGFPGFTSEQQLQIQQQHAVAAVAAAQQQHQALVAQHFMNVQSAPAALFGGHHHIQHQPHQQQVAWNSLMYPGGMPLAAAMGGFPQHTPLFEGIFA